MRLRSAVICQLAFGDFGAASAGGGNRAVFHSSVHSVSNISRSFPCNSLVLDMNKVVKDGN